MSLPKPYYQDEAVTLYHGDALDIVGGLDAFDAVLMDPPYCSGGFSEAGRKAAKGQGLRSETIKQQGWFVGDNMGTAGIAWLLRNVAVSAFPILSDGGSVCCFTDWRMLTNIGPAIESAGFRWQNLVVWDKKAAGLGTGFRAQHEMVLHYVKGVGVFHNCSMGNVIQVSRTHHTEREHQTQKPVELMASIVRVICPPAGIVLDPFAGSGSTLIAAKQEGRKSIGIERDEAYCEVIARRMAQEVLAL
jgi:DNA modification methylase